MTRTERFAGKTGEQTVATHTLTAERLHALAEIYEQGHVSDLMDRTLAKRKPGPKLEGSAKQATLFA